MVGSTKNIHKLINLKKLHTLEDILKVDIQFIKIKHKQLMILYFFY